MNFLKKIQLYNSYKRILKKNKVTLEGDFNIRIDRANRIYTVVNVPEDLFGEPFNLRKADIDTISMSYIREYINRLSIYLNQIGLNELYDFYEPIKKVDKYSYLVILGFKPMNSVEYNNTMMFRVLPISVGILIVSLVLYLILR
jgi:hypothetical protein